MRRRRLMGMYRGLRKSIGCRDSVKQSAAARPGGATQRTKDLPDRMSNLADRKPEHNRRTSRSQAAKVPRSRHVDLWILCQYARQDFARSQVLISGSLAARHT